MKKTFGYKAVTAGLVLAAALHALPALAEAPRVGDRFGDWTFECNAVAQGQTECALTQVMMDAKRKTPVAKISLSKDEKSSTRFLIAVVPLGIDALVPIYANIDDGKALILQLLTCVPGGCIARLPLEPGVVEAMKGGKSINISVKFLGSATPAVFPVSLNGLSTGYSAAGLE